MDQEREKREAIFQNYKKSISKAKFAPLNKYALDIGNPSQVEVNDHSDYKVNDNLDNAYFEYRLKILEKKLSTLYLISITSIILALVSIILFVYK